MNERREFLQQAALFIAALSGCRRDPQNANDAKDAAGTVTASASSSPKKAGIEHAFLPSQRKTLEAATWRILPSDQDPGAKEANVIEYIDRELARPEYPTLKRHVLAGIVAIDRLSERYGNKAFAELSVDEQDEVISLVQKKSDRGKDFIKFLVLLTIEGFVSDPMYGGNQGGVGWKLIGYGPGNPDGSGEGGHGGAHH